MHISVNNLLLSVKEKNLISLTENEIRNNLIPIRILADGNRFNQYICHDYGFIPHTCILKGDSKYLSIAAASIIAKEYHDEYIIDLCKTDSDLEKYGLLTSMGYGTKKHYEALQKYGATKYHRLSFNLHLGD
jgi:ribonuclease HII